MADLLVWHSIMASILRRLVKLKVEPLTLVKLRPLMDLTAGRPDVVVGLTDGPADTTHPGLPTKQIRHLPNTTSPTCRAGYSLACNHGTLIAGFLAAHRGTTAPAICPDCTLLVRPIFTEDPHDSAALPVATLKELARAIVDCIAAGAQIVNLSAAPIAPWTSPANEITEAFNYAVSRGVIIIAAAGNQATLGISPITRHPWVISVSACDLTGTPLNKSNNGGAFSRNSLLAPGIATKSLAAGGKTMTIGGTSAAAAFVTGAAALLLSLFPEATPMQIRAALVQAGRKQQRRVVPPVLNALAAFESLQVMYKRVG